MKFLLIGLITLEFILGMFFVTNSFASDISQGVLADNTIADTSNSTDTPIATGSPVETPTDAPTTSPEENPTSTPADTTTPIGTSSPTETSIDTPSPVDTSTPKETSSSPETNQMSINPKLEIEQLANSPILASFEENTSSDQISKQTIATAQTEDQQLAQTQSPQGQEQILVHFADDKINNIDTSIQVKDYATISFTTQRLSTQIDQLTDIISNQLNGVEQQSAIEDLQALCAKTNSVLRSTQETVPDQLEADIEEVRGKCLVQFGYNLGQ